MVQDLIVGLAVAGALAYLGLRTAQWLRAQGRVAYVGHGGPTLRHSGFGCGSGACSCGTATDAGTGLPGVPKRRSRRTEQFVQLGVKQSKGP